LPEFLSAQEIERFGKELDKYRSELFKKEYLPRVKPFPKVRELFQRIRDDKKRIVLASSGKKDDTKYYIKLLKIDNGAGGSRATKTGEPERVRESGDEPINFIEGYTAAADRSKPAPDLFSAAFEKLSVLPNEAITVGDTRFDIEAAAKAGLSTVAVTCGGTSEAVLREAGAIAIYRDPADLLAHYDTLLP
jgi:phosphoglycolate phosphatase-like HAD superfamily hydrolase